MSWSLRLHRPSFRLPSPILLTLFVSLAVFPYPTLLAQTLGDSAIGQDANGNLFINTTLGAKLLLNGVDISALAADVSTLRSAAAAAAAAAAEAAAPRKFFFYAVGGEGRNGTFLSSVEKLDIDTRTWSAAPPLNTSRTGHCVLFFRTGIYALGGHNAQGVLSSVEFFLNNAAWTLVAPMNSPRTQFAAVTFNLQLVVIGGRQIQPTTIVRTMEKYDGWAWFTTGALPFELYGHSAAVSGGAIFVAGGHDGTAPSNAVRVFDGLRWTVADTKVSRIHGALVSLNSHLYSFGGRPNEADPPYNTLDRLDFSAMERMPSAPYAVHQAGCALFVGVLFVVGGVDSKNEIIPNVSYYDASIPAWSVFSTPLTTPRKGFGLALN